MQAISGRYVLLLGSDWDVYFLCVRGIGGETDQDGLCRDIPEGADHWHWWRDAASDDAGGCSAADFPISGLRDYGGIGGACGHFI